MWKPSIRGRFGGGGSLDGMSWLIVLMLLMPTPTPPTPRTPASPRTPVERAAATAYTWPLTEVRVTRRFDPPPEPWLPGHRGVDLAGRPGQIVTASAQGRVSFAGSVAGRGVVSIVHPGGIKTTYEPVSPTVQQGDAVNQGTPIGELASGHEGCPVAACLHWGALRGEAYLDPLSLLGLGPIRLKPLTGAPAALPPAAARPRRTRRPGRRSAAARRCP
jgi:murein DD-endopeptidase MepM/ murein hydrolase activator NlpD